MIPTGPATTRRDAERAMQRLIERAASPDISQPGSLPAVPHRTRIGAGTMSRYVGRAAELLAQVDLGFDGYISALTGADPGFDIIAAKKGAVLYAQVKHPAEIVVRGGEVWLQYHIDARPLEGLAGDAAFHYCLLLSAPQVAGFGIHFAWMPAARLAAFFRDVYRRRASRTPREFTLRLRASADGTRLFYTYRGKKEYDLSDTIDSSPKGVARKTVGMPWEAYTVGSERELAGEMVARLAAVELLSRGLSPAFPIVDTGVDIIATPEPEGRAPGPRHFQVKTATSYDRGKGRWAHGRVARYFLRRSVFERTGDMDIIYVLAVERNWAKDKAVGRTQPYKMDLWNMERRFATVPQGTMDHMVAGLAPADRNGEHIRLSLWFRDDIGECWAIDGKGKAVMDLTCMLDDWDAVLP